MTEPASPNSNADSSLNAGRASAPKDKACPFCRQPFTSSSLGRHLDLYIKEKNPKAADGVHDVDAIRKLRGSITRRQPRSSMAKREGSTPMGTPRNDSNSRKSPASDGALTSPRVRPLPTELAHTQDVSRKRVRSNYSINSPSWQATGVINNIPTVPLHGGDFEEGEAHTRFERAAPQNQHALAKANFGQKQKLLEAQDNSRAAELALRELLSGLRAAAQRVQPSLSPFDYDPLTLDFTALAIHCLPPPPTIDQVAPIASPTSWSITPPEQQQYEALQQHFASSFHGWRVTVATRYNGDSDSGISFPLARESEEALINAADEFEEKVTRHLLTTFSHWSSLPRDIRAEIWRLALARAVGRKERTIQSLKTHTETILQENAHLRAQVELLSRCQQPREFQMMPPATVPINSQVAVELGNMGIRGGGTGLSLLDKDDSVQGQVEKSITRWRAVVRASRGEGPTNSIAGIQRKLGPTSLEEGMDVDAEGEVDGDESHGERLLQAPLSSFGGNGRGSIKQGGAKNGGNVMDGGRGSYQWTG